MGESNGVWGEFAEHNPDMADAWDSFGDLPKPGNNKALDVFLERKNLDIAALHRLGAKMRSPVALALPFNGTGLKYRDIVTGKRSGYRGSKYPLLRILRSSQQSQGVVLCEGETDAGRLTMIYPELDVGLMGAGAKSFTKAMAQQVGTYPMILVGLDNDKAGEEGFAKIKELLPDAIRFAPPEGKKDWCEIADGDDIPDLPAAPEPAEEEPPPGLKVGGLFFPDMAVLLDQDLASPDQIVPDVFFEEGVHWVDGHPGSGKTSFVMSCASMLMEENIPVVWLDYEGGVRPSLRRLLATGAQHHKIVKHFHYIGWPPKAEDYVAQIAETWPGAPIIFDSASKALADAGLSENDNSEVTSWTVKLVKACKTYSICLIVIDHVTKAATNQYARGAGAKAADTDVHWRVHKQIPFSQNQEGLVHLEQLKDREGCLPFDLWSRVGGERGLRFGALEREDPTGEKEGREGLADEADLTAKGESAL